MKQIFITFNYSLLFDSLFGGFTVCIHRYTCPPTSGDFRIFSRNPEDFVNFISRFNRSPEFEPRTIESPYTKRIEIALAKREINNSKRCRG